MSKLQIIQEFESLAQIASNLRDDLKGKEAIKSQKATKGQKAIEGQRAIAGQKVILLYAYNGVGKTRLSMEFKKQGGNPKKYSRDTLYYNAFTEDLFYWDNDLKNDAERVLKMNSASNFFNGFKDIALEEKIFSFLERYVSFDFKIDYQNWSITFKKGDQDNIKISRGEENIFIWCFFLAVCELAIDGDETYNWVKYFYVDDPISSLDDSNAIGVACDLSELIKRADGKIKTVVSSHHTLFFNAICNELRHVAHKRCFLHGNSVDGYTLRKTNDTPFYHHVASLSQLKSAAESGDIKREDFNILRSILEKTASFFGYNDFETCLIGIDDKERYQRALNLLSHGKHSVFEAAEVDDKAKSLFKDILTEFLKKYHFELPTISTVEPAPPLVV